MLSKQRSNIQEETIAMDLRKIKLNAPAADSSAEQPESAGQEIEAADLSTDNQEYATNHAEPEYEMPEEEMPILIPDDYDVEDIDYSARNTMSDVVAAKDNITEVPRYERPKLTGKEALENFWYHNKTTVIVCIAAAVMLIAVLIQSIPTKYDHCINIYADARMGVYSIEEIEKQFMEYAEDVDGTGEVKLNINSYNINGNSDPYESIVAYMIIETEFSGEYSAFLTVVDKPHYDFIVENVGTEAFEAYEDYPALISLKNSEFITGTSESNNNDTELFLALVAMPDRFKDDAEMQARHDNAKALLGRILDAHPELAKAE